MEGGSRSVQPIRGPSAAMTSHREAFDSRQYLGGSVLTDGVALFLDFTLASYACNKTPGDIL